MYNKSGNHCSNIWDCWIKSPAALQPLQNWEKWDKMALFGGFCTFMSPPLILDHPKCWVYLKCRVNPLYWVILEISGYPITDDFQNWIRLGKVSKKMLAGGRIYGNLWGHDCCTVAMMDRVILLLFVNSALAAGDCWEELYRRWRHLSQYWLQDSTRKKHSAVPLPLLSPGALFQNWLHLKLQCYVQTCQANTIDAYLW